MSDAQQNGRPLTSAPRFFRRVIDGAFDRVSPLEPRRPSRFEPQALGVIDTIADRRDPLGGEEEHSTRAAVAGGAHSPARSRLPNADATVRPVRSQRDLEVRGPRATADRPLETGDREPEMAADLDERSSPRSSANRVGLRTPPPIPVPIEIDARRQRSGRTDSVPPPLPIDASVGTLLVRPLRSMPEPAADRKPAHDESTTPVRERSKGAVVEPGKVAPHARHDLLQARTAAMPAPEPIVNVTIGRIEVRMVPTAQAPTRPRPEGPKPMSLDQYLRQRGGRR